jgi:hypothetical protein
VIQTDIGRYVIEVDIGRYFLLVVMWHSRLRSDGEAEGACPEGAQVNGTLKSDEVQYKRVRYH